MIDRLFGRPLWLQVVLDVAGVVLSVATFAQVLEPGILLHVVWIVLALEAFAFGLAVTSIRIVLASLVVFAYAVIGSGDASPQAAALLDLDVAEWPLMVVISVIVAVMADRLSATSRRYAALYRTANGRLLTAQEDERQKLARDVHDGLGQTITAVSLTLDAAGSLLDAESESNREALRVIGRAQELTATALTESRDVALRLRPARLRENGLAAALAELAGSAGRPVTFRFEPALRRPGAFEPEIEVELYRIAQEALGNSVRHAGEAHRWISATADRDHFRLEVGDDGAGFDVRTSRQRGLGLASMQERAAAIGARLTVESRPGSGTIVRCDLSVPGASIAQASATAPPPAERAAIRSHAR